MNIAPTCAPQAFDSSPVTVTPVMCSDSSEPPAPPSCIAISTVEPMGSWGGIPIAVAAAFQVQLVVSILEIVDCAVVGNTNAGATHVEIRHVAAHDAGGGAALC